MISPVVISSILLNAIGSTVLIYLLKEKHWFHGSWESERLFWRLIGASLTFIVLFASDDAPLSVSFFGGEVVFILMGGEVAVKLWARTQRWRLANFDTQCPDKHSSTLSVRKKAYAVKDVILRLEKSMFRGLRRAFWNSQLKALEMEAVDILNNCNAQELDYVVCTVNLGRLLVLLQDTDSRVGVAAITGMFASVVFNGGEMHAMCKDVHHLMDELVVLGLAAVGAYIAAASQWRVQRNRFEAIELLAVDRVDQLGPYAKAVILDALQKMGTRTHKNLSDIIANVFLSTHGRDLLMLKALLDQSGSVYNLHRLVFQFVEKSSRETILRHIEEEGACLESLNIMKVAPTSSTRSRAQSLEQSYSPLVPSFNSYQLPDSSLCEELSWLELFVGRGRGARVLSDIDDTLFCSDGKGIGGVDKRFPKKQVYPGVVEFYRELNRGSTGIEIEGPNCGCLVFLSARPHLHKDVTRLNFHMFNRLRTTNIDSKLHTNPTLLAGDMGSVMGLRWNRHGLVLSHFSAIAEKKTSNFEQYAQLYPESYFVFIGDNGQGDVAAAEMMFRKSQHLEHVFIHKVKPIEETYGYRDEAEAEWTAMGISFFDTYVGAALKAYKLNLIDTQGLYNVANGASTTIQRLKNNCLFSNAEYERLCISELIVDLSRANVVLPLDMQCAVPQ